MGDYRWEEEARLRAEEAAARQRAAEEANRRQAAEEANRRLAAEEAAARQRQDEQNRRLDYTQHRRDLDPIAAGEEIRRRREKDEIEAAQRTGYRPYDRDQSIDHIQRIEAERREQESRDRWRAELDAN